MQTNRISNRMAASAFGEALVRIGTVALKTSLAIPEGRAELAMQGVVQAVFTELARTVVYVPAGLDSRNLEVWRKFHEPSHGAAACSSARVNQLGAEYGVSTRSIYSILNGVRQSMASQAPSQQRPEAGMADGPQGSGR